MGAPSKDFRDYYGGKEAHRFIRPGVPTRPRTRGERMASAVWRGSLAVLLFVHAPVWLVALLAAACVASVAVEWWLGHQARQTVGATRPL